MADEVFEFLQNSNTFESASAHFIQQKKNLFQGSFIWWEQVDVTRTFYKREIVEIKPYIMDILGIEEDNNKFKSSP